MSNASTPTQRRLRPGLPRVRPRRPIRDPRSAPQSRPQARTAARDREARHAAKEPQPGQPPHGDRTPSSRHGASASGRTRRLLPQTPGPAAGTTPHPSSCVRSRPQAGREPTPLPQPICPESARPFSIVLRLLLRPGCEIRGAGSHGDLPPTRDVAHLDHTPPHAHERAVAAVRGEPIRATDGGRRVAALRSELALAVTP